jgi:hypothetical protein
MTPFIESSRCWLPWGEVPNNHANNLSSLLIPEDGRLIFTNNILEGSWFKLEEGLPRLAIPVVRIGCHLPVFFPDFLRLICLINIMPMGGVWFLPAFKNDGGDACQPITLGCWGDANRIRKMFAPVPECGLSLLLPGEGCAYSQWYFAGFSLQLRLSNKMHSKNLISLTGKQLKIGRTAF